MEKSIKAVPVWKKVLRYLLIAIGVLGLLAIFFLLTDAPLSQKASNWFFGQEENHIAPEQNAYYYWAGFGLPEGSSPVDTLRMFTERFNQLVERGLKSDREELPEDPLFLELRAIANHLPVGDLDSLRALLEQPGYIDDLTLRASFLDERFDHLGSLDIFDTPFHFTQVTPFGLGLSLISYQNLRNVRAIHAYERGQVEKAVALTGASFQTARKLRGEVDYLLATLQQNVQLQSVLLRAVNPMLDWRLTPAPELVDFVRNLELLTPGELSMRKALRNESWMMIRGYNAQPEDDPVPRKQERAFLFRTLARPNATMNLVAEAYSRLSDKSELQGVEYSQERDNPLLRATIADHLRSFIGVMQAETIAPVVGYIDSGLSINGFIMLLKAKTEILAGSIAPGDIPRFLNEHQNEYFNPLSGGSLEWNEETHTLYFTGPDQENQANVRQVTILFPE